MVGFLYAGNGNISKFFDKRVSEIFGYEVKNDEEPKSPHITSDDNSKMHRYLCIVDNRMLFSHHIMQDGAIIPQKNPDVNFYITVNAKSPKTLELVTDVHSIQEIWHDFGLFPENEPLVKPTKLAFDLFDSKVSYNELNEEIKEICGGKSDFTVSRCKWGGGLQCYYKNSPCTVEDLFSIFQ